MEDLRELGIRRPKLYVRIHERYHMKHPEKGEYEVRKKSDEIYEELTGEKIDTTAYLSSGEEHVRYAERLGKEFD